MYYQHNNGLFLVYIRYGRAWLCKTEQQCLQELGLGGIPLLLHQSFLCLTSLKPNSTPVVAIFVSSTMVFSGNGGIGKSPFWRAFEQMSNGFRK